MFGWEFEKGRMAADLPEFEKGVQNGELRLLESLDRNGLPHFLVHRSADGFIKITLHGAKFDGMNEDGLGRKLFRNLVFGATENERSEPGAEKVATFIILIFFNQILIKHTKTITNTKKSKNKKTKKQPKFTKIIFN